MANKDCNPANADLHIRRLSKSDVEQVVQLSLPAWAPVFNSFEKVLGADIYKRIWPEWRASQKSSIEGICAEGANAVVLVAELDGKVVGFAAYKLDTAAMTGEVLFLAVHPSYQERGVGTELNRAMLRGMKEEGMTLAIAETGGDPGHAPTRRSYEKAGYTGLPLVRYFKEL